ncbi:helix-turn-helix domain-containing protein [Pseudomonas sp. LS1212]|uniref:helix-turn-helix domain-containing protein n=1 Tax=Pseudomonas sp. LS1212 TaxID=2972478 RepID=UPI00215C1D5F|nr:helix-turn-helix transcriptional regulator [Pseudomonas sp. LS1212]UVJ44845.1 helix-turn-helix domain-containing protein [Pseudomonas sp. LS1212]
MELKQAFATALKALRQKKHRTQEDFYLVSSRTYISTLERGLKSPTLDKLEDIAGVLGVHPATLVISTYMNKDDTSLDSIIQCIRADLTN